MSALFALPAFAAAILTAMLLSRLRPPAAPRKWRTLDGLRGIAATAVFLHHSAIWFAYSKSGNWLPPPTNLYNQLGQGAVSVFFMLTGFLFWAKLRETPEMDWERLYISRVLRIAPVYAVSMLVLVAVAWLAAGRPLHIGNATPFLEIASFANTPDLFHLRNTFVINAGVAWTLHYEWFFYCMLPFLALALHRFRGFSVRSLLYLCFSAAGALLMWHYYIIRIMLLFFVLGIGSYEIGRATRETRLHRLLESWPGTLWIFVMLWLIVSRFHDAYNPRAALLYGAAFLPIAAGNSMFGVLTTVTLRKLGEISYSLYLLQGLVLYAFFHASGATQTLRQHWGLAIPAAILLVCLGQISFSWVEHPSMHAVERARSFLRQFAPWRLMFSRPASLS